jgi:hypothetical protein
MAHIPRPDNIDVNEIQSETHVHIKGYTAYIIKR